MMFTAMLLMCLLGTIAGEDHGENPEIDDAEKMLSSITSQSDMPDELENAALGDNTLKEKPNMTIKSVTLDQNCPPGDVSCYYRFFNTWTTFASAQHTCRRYRGNLSSFHNAHATNQVCRNVRKSNRSVSYVWIGVWKPNGACRYRNIDGSCMNYSNWAPGQPSGTGGRCIALYVHSGKWYAAHCGTRLPFLCTF